MNKIVVNIRSVLFSWRFLLNYAVILVATSWIPMLSRTIVMRDNDGLIIQEVTITSRLYQSWWAVARFTPGMSSHGRAVLWHLGVCFVIAFAVWYITLSMTPRPVEEASVDESPRKSDADAPPEEE